MRFPRPGPWALSLMDLDGIFYDCGVREVGSRRPAASAVTGTGESTRLTWLIAAGGLAITAGVAFAVRGG